MDFSNAPIALLEYDNLSVSSETNEDIEMPCNGVLKRSMSDPFDIAMGLQLETSLEQLVWTFDEHVTNPYLYDAELPSNFEKSKKRNDTALAAVKSFWRISIAPIDNPRHTYPLEKCPILLDSDEFHMADADSVSEADSKEGLHHKDISVLRHREKSDDEDTVATNSINPFSSSESLCSLSSNAMHDTILLKVTPLDSGNTYDVPINGIRAVSWQPEVEEAVGNCEDDELEASLNKAELQASLEAFKTRHPSLPKNQTTAWLQELSRLSPQVLSRYVEELEMETNEVSEQLICCLAEREEQILFREVQDDFVVLHNAVHVRRRRAAEAVLANTSHSLLPFSSRNALRLALFRRATKKDVNASGSLIELSELPSEDEQGGSSMDSLSSSSLSSRTGINSSSAGVIKRGGRHIGDVIELPRLRNALGRFKSLFANYSIDQLQIPKTVLSQVAEDEWRQRHVAPESAPLVRSRGLRKHVGSLPSPYLPWPLGRPEWSQTLKLVIPVPPENLLTWLPSRLRLINQILQASLQESPTVSAFIEELENFDPEIESNNLNQKMEKFTSLLDIESGETRPPPSRQVPRASSKKREPSRKTVTFNWSGTKEAFNVLSKNQNGSTYIES